MLFTLALMNWTLGVSSAFALSAVALIGYLFGRSQRTQPEAENGASDEIRRASRIANQLEQIADELRQDLAYHRSKVEHFKAQLRRAAGQPGDEGWERLRDEAENMVGPTLQLVSQLSTAYDKIRQQSQSLANFTGGRTDPLTGLANSRSLEEHLEVLLKSRGEGGGDSCVVIVSLEQTAGDRAQQDDRVREIGRRLAAGLRGEDFAARYGVDDFVVVLPDTPLAGAGVFGTRLRETIQKQYGVAISCGLAQSMPADTPKSLLKRADSAAYSARAAGPGQQFVHTGVAIRPDSRTRPADAEAPAPVSDAEAARAPLPAVQVELAGPDVAGNLLAAGG